MDTAPGPLFLNGWRGGVRFDGEFASNKRSYAGTGTIRRVW